MAGMSVPGLGSGLDVQGMVQQLVAAERAPHTQRLTRQEVKVTTEVSALGSLKGSLSTFSTALAGLKDAAAFGNHKATSADQDVFAVSVSGSATAGHYDIEVVRLAKAHQLASPAFAGGSTAEVGHGTLTLSLGEKSFDVAIAEGKGTLADVRDAINKAANNPGITATLVNGVAGSQLVLTSTKTGAESAIKIAASGGDGGLAQLQYDPDGVMNMTELEPAQSALVRVSGIDVASETNVVSDGIDGVTLTLKKESAGEEVALDVTFDSASVLSKVQKFVTDYNSMQENFSRLRAYNPTTGTAGPLLGDSLLRGIESQVRRDLTSAVSSATSEYNTLASIGIKTTTSGTLELDTAKLRKVLEADPDAIASLFSSENGVATRLHNSVQRVLDSKGDIATRNTSLNDSLKKIKSEKDQVDVRMAQIEQRYLKQFTALDGLLTQMQSTSAYLAQQLSSIAKIG